MGTQFTREEWEKLCHLNEVKISMSHKGGFTDNAHIERFCRTLKFESLNMAGSQAYEYVDNSDELPTSPQVQQQP